MELRAGSPPNGEEILERAARIELASSAWKAEVLPLHNARCVILLTLDIYFRLFDMIAPYQAGGGGDWIRTNVHIVIRFTV